MNLQSKLEQFRSDNPYDVNTQAKRLLATDDKELILYTLALGLATAKQRQRHYERDFIKNVGEAPAREILVPRPGGPTASVVPITIKPSKKAQNAMAQLILAVWMVGDKPLGDCTHVDLSVAVKRERASQEGHGKNIQFYESLIKTLNPKKDDKVNEKWNQDTIRDQIRKVYGEFRTQAAGEAA